jgi:hypothetical protein
MNQEIKEKWIAALRSGEYNQTTGKLKTSSGYCCAGVLCDLYRKETGNGEWDEFNRFVSNYRIDAYTLPDAVVLWSGFQNNTIVGRKINSPLQIPENGGEPVTIFEINDGYFENDIKVSSKSFNEIADIIEEKVK